MKAWFCILKQPSLSLTSAVSRDFTWLIIAVVNVSKHIMTFRSSTFPIAINDKWTRSSTDIEQMVGVSKGTHICRLNTSR